MSKKTEVEAQMPQLQPQWYLGSTLTSQISMLAHTVTYLLTLWFCRSRSLVHEDSLIALNENACIPPYHLGLFLKLNFKKWVWSKVTWCRNSQMSLGWNCMNSSATLCWWELFMGTAGKGKQSWFFTKRVVYYSFIFILLRVGDKVK